MWTESMVFIVPLIVIIAALWTANGEHSMNYYERDAQKGMWQH
ncbi:hypothetical protein [Mycobacterium sp. NPDC050853]